MNNIVVICEDINCANKLKELAKDFNYNVEFEIQKENEIINEISTQCIREAKAILFVLDKGIDEIDEIERFIDIEYYEVEPNIALENPSQVIKEIISDLN
ncbi:hypothetical protein GCM10008904_16160 [Paraclostridium ghonii]|uniref:Fructose-specific phosphotransferase system component IIB n=1 Tax=Paraclostridium ghonii TaxID=29358 RepID=A0ABU0N076_9FIRM|nr:PTS sugar transporter subunit IIBC [Paeniclostridium ghonii]MDQ0556264.1 fructose-specific phosphotransferase system component IIB [Paeniclostridium ghonii]